VRSPFVSRRHWLGSAAVGVGACGSMSGWLPALANQAETKPAKSVIVLWMNGGPSTIDLWDLKEGNENGGPFRSIETSAPGLRISEHLPKLAKHGQDLAVIRSLATKEGDHDRATYLLRTGYTPMGAIQFPAVGAALARELANRDLANGANRLPNMVSIAPSRYALQLGGGFLGPQYNPLSIGEATGTISSLKVTDIARQVGVSDDAQQTRLDILTELEREFSRGRDEAAVAASIQSATSRAIQLMTPAAAKAFELDEEPDETRDRYGRTLFGQGVLLARRLVERGVPFVEVTLDGWDTHQNNFERVKELSGHLDGAFASLMEDLKQRGLLESTVVVCQGEFGRTPKINGNTGRDHWPNAWAVALAGGGIKTGQAIGQTSSDGTTVEDHRATVPDLIATIATAIGVDPQKQNMSNVGRPIRIADPAAKPIAELL
jgi:uncharacterized protein (DUF1501 family)